MQPPDPPFAKATAQRAVTIASQALRSAAAAYAGVLEVRRELKDLDRQVRAVRRSSGRTIPHLRLCPFCGVTCSADRGACPLHEDLI